jgi:hypothetical protein
LASITAEALEELSRMLEREAHHAGPGTMTLQGKNPVGAPLHPEPRRDGEEASEPLNNSIRYFLSEEPTSTAFAPNARAGITG